MSVTLHTNHGDIKCEIFCDLVQKASYNFLALAASGSYDNTLFHRYEKINRFCCPIITNSRSQSRNIKGFMLQGGDPTGTGKGGESIYGNHFNDQFHPDLKHDKRGVLSFANNGPDTNGSQFFFTYAAQPHLNNQYTIFGQVCALKRMTKIHMLIQFTIDFLFPFS